MPSRKDYQTPDAEQNSPSDPNLSGSRPTAPVKQQSGGAWKDTESDNNRYPGGLPAGADAA